MWERLLRPAQNNAATRKAYIAATKAMNGEMSIATPNAWRLPSLFPVTILVTHAATSAIPPPMRIEAANMPADHENGVRPPRQGIGVSCEPVEIGKADEPANNRELRRLRILISMFPLLSTGSLPLAVQSPMFRPSAAVAVISSVSLDLN